MDFNLTPEQKELQERARKFTREYITPYANELEKQNEVPIDIVQKAYELGLMNLHVPKDVGGPGLELLEETLVAEAIGYGCAGCATSINVNNLALAPILLAATKEQLKKYITPIITGEKVKFMSFCLTERMAGSDAAAITTRAIKDGEQYIINGEKCFISSAPLAALHSVFAKLEPEIDKKPHRNMAVFMVPADLPGVSIGHIENKVGQRCSTQSEVIFEDVRIPVDCLVGKEGQGFYLSMQTLDMTRAGIAAIATGVAQRALDEAARYANVRKQFGQSIGRFQGISFILADLQAKVLASRQLTRYAAWLADQGIRNSMESACAKFYASDTAMEGAINAIQVLGGYGYMEEYPVEKLMRDAKLLQIYEGTNEIQRLVAGNAVLKGAPEATGFELKYPGRNAPQI
ncbi:MAG: acyl-CoA dehydrogenase family protein [Candidatus Hodarchaeota archaeon]